MRSLFATNLLLCLIAVILSGSIAFALIYAAPVYIAIIHESQVETAREYKAAAENYCQTTEYIVSELFVPVCSSDQATKGGAE